MSATKRAGALTRANSAQAAGVTITHPERIVYPGIAMTKLQLAEYYALVAPLMLPHVQQRPISAVRCPDGQGGECFFQKHWPPRGGAAVHTKQVPESNGELTPYAFASTARDLVALVQNGVIETHVWGARYDSLEKPDRLVLDLDPDPSVSWSVVKTSALQLRTLLHDVGLDSWVKLTGGKGVHVVVPFERRIEWSVLSAFSRAVAEHLSRVAPLRYVSKASKSIRTKRIFVDWLRNTRGATWVAPWSARARDGAPVSMPLSWDDLAALKRPDQFGIPKVSKMLAKGMDDPWSAMLTAKQRITAEMAEHFLKR